MATDSRYMEKAHVVSARKWEFRPGGREGGRKGELAGEDVQAREGRRRGAYRGETARPGQARVWRGKRARQTDPAHACSPKKSHTPSLPPFLPPSLLTGVKQHGQDKAGDSEVNERAKLIRHVHISEAVGPFVIRVGEADLDQVHGDKHQEEGEGLDKVVEPVAALVIGQVARKGDDGGQAEEEDLKNKRRGRWEGGSGKKTQVEKATAGPTFPPSLPISPLPQTYQRVQLQRLIRHARGTPGRPQLHRQQPKPKRPGKRAIRHNERKVPIAHKLPHQQGKEQKPRPSSGGAVAVFPQEAEVSV